MLLPRSSRAQDTGAPGRKINVDGTSLPPDSYLFITGLLAARAQDGVWPSDCSAVIDKMKPSGPIKRASLMTRPASTPASAREILAEIVRNMREGLEPMLYSVLAPVVYRVYLHPDDLARLRAIVPRIVDEARQALNAEVERMNRITLSQKLSITNSPRPAVETPAQGWTIEILENTDEAGEPGEIVIYSELAVPAKPDYGTGKLTKRIATRRLSGSAQQSYREDSAVSASQCYATLTYEDNKGRGTFRMVKSNIVIGRGGQAYWTDLTLHTVPDVSREHLRLRRDETTGEFYLKDLSRLGTSIDGRKAPSSIEFVDGEKRDKNLEVKLPKRARIGLADVVFLDFEAGDKV